MKKGILRNANLQIGKGGGKEPIVLLGEGDTYPVGTLSDINFILEKGGVIVTDADTSETLYPNKMYEFGEVSSIDINLSTPVSGELNEWQFSFDSGSTATTFSVPSGVVWTSTVTIKANMHYECNIVYDETSEKYFGIIVGWAIS